MANLELQLRQAVVRAPETAVITVVKVRSGDVLQPGKVGITVARQQGLEFEGLVLGADVAHLQAGMPVQLKLDAYDYQKYGTLAGTLRFIAPDSEVVEEMGKPQATVYRVRIALARKEIGQREEMSQVNGGFLAAVAAIISIVAGVYSIWKNWRR